MTDSPLQNLEPLEKVNVNKKKQNHVNRSGRGGRRIGAGRKKGSKAATTLLREEAALELVEKNEMKARILKSMPHRLQMSEKALKEAIKEINEEEIEEVFKKRVALHSNSLLTSMLSVAQGEKFLYKVVEAVDNSGKVKRKHVLVTDSQEIANYLDNPLEAEGSDYFYISTKSPDVTAINSLFDRFMGRPTSKIVGPDNPDGSEGPLKIISVNYAQPAPVQAQVVADSSPNPQKLPSVAVSSDKPQPIPGSSALPAKIVAEEVIKEAIKE